MPGAAPKGTPTFYPLTLHSPSGRIGQERMKDRMRNSALWASDSPRRYPPACLRYSAADKGSQHQATHPHPGPLKGRECRPLSLRERAGVRGGSGGNQPSMHTTRFSPSAPPLFSEKIGGRRRGLSERAARVPQPPDLFGKPRVARRAGAAGCPFVWLLIFWASKIK